MGIKKTINSRDGHIYYVIETSDGKKIYIGMFFLDHYEDLSTVTGEPGLWFVRDAAADDTGQNGDPTVHKGWAIYTWDDKKKTVDGEGVVRYGGWYKIAEQESVDGPWGIDEVVRKSFVTKTEFNQTIAVINTRLLDLERRVAINEQNIQNLIDAVDDLKKYKHWHTNLAVLNGIDGSSCNLSYQGRTTGVYFYDNTVGGKLYWRDPTVTDAEDIEKENTLAIAQAFAQTILALPGMTFCAMEPDGSFSEFAMVRGSTTTGYIALKYLSQICSDRKYYNHTVVKEEETTVDKYTEITKEEATTALTEGTEGYDLFFTDKVCDAVPKSSTYSKSYGSVIFVDALPTASKQNDGRGVWYLLKDDGTYAPHTFYISQNGVWKNIELLSGDGEEILVEGATFTCAYSSDDPQMPFKKNYLFWTEPADNITEEAWWSSTTLVRKVGSAPESVTDGVEVCKVSKERTNSYVDICPYSTEPVYYRLFSVTRAGQLYTASDAVNPQNLTWEKIFEIADQKMLGKLFSIGDTIVLPKHPKFGNIECEVLAVNEAVESVKGSITVATKEELSYMAFGSTSAFGTSDLQTWLSNNFNLYTKLKLSEDGTPQSGKTYYTFNDGFKVLEDAETFPEGVDIYEPDEDLPNGLIASFEIPSPTETIGYSNITKTKYHDHLKVASDWWTRDPSDDKVVTGSGATADPTTELGAVVVFTLQEL